MKLEWEAGLDSSTEQPFLDWYPLRLVAIVNRITTPHPYINPQVTTHNFNLQISDSIATGSPRL